MSATQNIKLGLLTETITLGFSDDNYVIEKVEFEDYQRPKVEFIVSEGVKAIIKGVTYNSGAQVKFDKSELKSCKSIYLHKASWNTNVEVQKFFGGSYDLSLSISPTTRGGFAVVGSASVEINHYPTLINYFGKSMRQAELETAISDAKIAESISLDDETENDIAMDDENAFDPFACFFNNNQDETTVSNDAGSISDDIAPIM